MFILLLPLLALLAGAGASAQDLPPRILVGYWHNWPGSPNSLRLTSVPQAYDVINVAFATSAKPSSATLQFTPHAKIYTSTQTFNRDVAALQKQGKKVLISIGGANHPVHLDSAAQVKTFVTSLGGIIKAHGFDGVDVDLEGSSLMLQSGDNDFTRPTSPRIMNLISALKQLQASFPKDFLLTFAPETAQVQGGYARYTTHWGAYLPVLHALRSNLSYVHVQHYNTGSMFGRDGRSYQPGTADFHVAMADMLLAGFKVANGKVFPPLAPGQVVIGLPATKGAAGSGFTSPQEIHKSLDYLILGIPFQGSYQLANNSGYPDFRGLMTWSINWDVQGKNAFNQQHRAYLDTVFLAASKEEVSQLGGSAGLTLRAGRGNAFRTYVLLGSMSGRKPGLALPGSGALLPLNYDLFTSLVLQNLNSLLFMGFLGTLNGNGQSSAMINIPPVPGGLGTKMDFAYLLYPALDFTSTAVTIRIGK